MPGPVVVGIDSSREAGYALAWATREARQSGSRLRIVHVTQKWDERAHPLGADLLAKAEAQVRAAELGLEVTTELAEGPPITVLAQFMRHAEMMVVGRRGIGGFTGLLLGSVAHGLSQFAECPVVTVPSPELPVVNRIVVGVKGTEANEAAIGFAFQQADRHRAELRAVHAWTEPTPSGPGDMLPLVYDVDGVQADESRLLAESLAGWRGRYPDVEVDAQTVRGHSVRVLDDRASDALLLVVGRHASTRPMAALLGSVAHGVLHHARCPVAVVPSTS